MSADVIALSLKEKVFLFSYDCRLFVSLQDSSE